MQKRKPVHKTLLIILIAFSALAGDVLSAKANYHIAVIYPDVRKPFNTFFENITEGMKLRQESNITIWPVPKTESPEAMSTWLQNTKPDAVILLGTEFKQFNKQLEGPFKLIYGASFFSRNHFEQGKAGISITPEPSILFKRLKKMAPQVTEINVVYHELTNGWLIDSAQVVAKELNLKLNKHPVENIKQAALTYKQIIENSSSPTKALWLLQHDPTLDEKSLLPRILADAWEHETIVFSSNPRHVKRGALFSSLPDNKQLGKDLVQKAIDILHGKNNNLEPMRSTLMVANKRTAKHLSLSADYFSEDDFTVIYPREK